MMISSLWTWFTAATQTSENKYDDDDDDDDGVSELEIDSQHSGDDLTDSNPEEHYLRLRNPPEVPDKIALRRMDDDQKRQLFEREYDKQNDERANMIPGQPCHVPSKFSAKIGNWQIERNIFISIQQNQCFPEDKKALTPNTYERRMHRLLWMEEAKQELEMRRYDIKGMLIGRYAGFFVIPVEGLAEGRPSLMRGDRVQLRSGSSMMYEAYIHDVREEDILVKTHVSCRPEDFDAIKFDIEFYSSRTPFRRCHHAARVAPRHNQQETLFPSTESQMIHKQPIIDVSEDGHELELLNGDLNEQQRKAVFNILRGCCRPAPYLVFGPPGTGKTVSLVEAILQVFKLKPGARILACCNSNSGTDLLATRLLDSGAVEERELLRLSAFYRMEKLIPDHLKHVSFDIDSLDANYWQKYRILVTTCIQAGSLYDHVKPGVGLYDYVFIDEAGHANEPETVIPITLMKPNGLVVLAGDPHQLGPVCISKIADECGLGESLLERLSRRDPYRRNLMFSKSGNYDSKFITKLLVNYRSDSRVMSINDKLFYDNELIYHIKSPTRCLKALDINFPLVFHAVKGRDTRDYSNPSWFNPNEAIVVMTYISRLYRGGFSGDQVGIVTPYRRQIDKIRSLFESASLDECKIATMEEFQGDEREIIIITTVRSRKRNIDHDSRFHLGFLFNPKRFNVAVSRAKWLVIVVGDPDILSRDRCWTEYVNLCKSKNTYFEEKCFTGDDKRDEDD